MDLGASISAITIDTNVHVTVVIVNVSNMIAM